MSKSTLVYATRAFGPDSRQGGYSFPGWMTQVGMRLVVLNLAIYAVLGVALVIDVVA